MAGILEVATQEFAEKGLAGARIDEIAAATQTSKRMIYYYFGSKEGLYIAVLEDAYRRVRSVEAEQDLEGLPPEQALRRLVEFTFDHHHNNPAYIRLVASENMNRAQFMAQSRIIQGLNVPAIEAIRKLYERGVASGEFRPGLDVVDIHASISALTFFNVSNRHTFGLIFKHDLGAPETLVDRVFWLTDQIKELQTERYNVCKVFVTFETEEGQRAALSALAIGRLDAMMGNKAACAPSALFRGKILLVDEPAEPSAVRWLDLSASNRRKNIMRGMNLCVTALMVAFAGFVVNKTRYSKFSGFAAPLISILNTIIPLVVKILMIFEPHGTEGSFQASLYMKITAFRWVNTAL